MERGLKDPFTSVYLDHNNMLRLQPPLDTTVQQPQLTPFGNEAPYPLPPSPMNLSTPICKSLRTVKETRCHFPTQC
jgi:hypothetical protein